MLQVLLFDTLTEIRNLLPSSPYFRTPNPPPQSIPISPIFSPTSFFYLRCTSHRDLHASVLSTTHLSTAARGYAQLRTSESATRTQ